jgi:pimeloyl-ACP methyl ester carboxylesterase
MTVEGAFQGAAARSAVSTVSTVEHTIENGDGWRLSLFQTVDEARFVRGRKPLLIVPGYGMNSFIFSFHPRGLSLEGYLAQAGFEVWRVDLRGQGGARSIGGGDRYGLEDLAATDLGATVRAVLARTRTSGTRVDCIGASLGGTIMFAHAVLDPAHRLGSLVSLGSPVRWVEIHPVLRFAFSSPALAGQLRLRGTRAIAGAALPFLARHAPKVLSIYMNAGITDTSRASEMVRTVEDPNRHVNREIAQWIVDRDLVLRGVSVTEGLARLTSPLLVVSANGDGIVPRATAEFPYEAIGASDKALLRVGDAAYSMAHADLFISDEAETRVFEPIASWLAPRAIA